MLGEDLVQNLALVYRNWVKIKTDAQQIEIQFATETAESNSRTF